MLNKNECNLLLQGQGDRDENQKGKSQSKRENE